MPAYPHTQSHWKHWVILLFWPWRSGMGWDSAMKETLCHLIAPAEYRQLGSAEAQMPTYVRCRRRKQRCDLRYLKCPSCEAVRVLCLAYDSEKRTEVPRNYGSILEEVGRPKFELDELRRHRTSKAMVLACVKADIAILASQSRARGSLRMAAPPSSISSSLPPRHAASTSQTSTSATERRTRPY
ncbi:hypothetical protein GGS23DRAFT_276025 [Durotheca rogersii]|uniref:uncharacterized protein n=1 Tax=Durotheca rogersii TaxID=419775 RepID=UPI00221EE29D|nr:uncharacterized protein GGS23DRAFT_276025 [Durotheca rogersii]KAI5866530.1 hypothetical protein GGS23DRAFT_276025 [Durotheca rogersii]